MAKRIPVLEYEQRHLFTQHAIVGDKGCQLGIAGLYWEHELACIRKLAPEYLYAGNQELACKELGIWFNTSS